MTPLILKIKAGHASNEDIAETLAEISILYRMHGGSGIDFKIKLDPNDPNVLFAIGMPSNL